MILEFEVHPELEKFFSLIFFHTIFRMQDQNGHLKIVDEVSILMSVNSKYL